LDLIKRLFKEKPMGAAGAIILLIIILVAIFANFIAPYPMTEIHLGDTVHPPSAKYLLGTDYLGRDLFTLIIYGARVSILIGLAGTCINILVALILGGVSGYFGGKIDMVIQRVIDAWMCFPPLFILLTIMAMFKSGIFQVIVVLGLFYGITNARVIRGTILSIKEITYMKAAESIGATHIRRMFNHILPNILAPIIVLFTISVGQIILSEATLSFLGFGVPPPNPSWGQMINNSTRYITQGPWMGIFPGLALSMVVFSINMLGDGLRDILDPRLRGGSGRYGKIIINKRLPGQKSSTFTRELPEHMKDKDKHI